MKKANPEYKMSELCQILDISLSTHYDHLNNEISERDKEITNKTGEIAVMNKHTDGKRRIQKELNGQGVSIGLYKTASLMKQANIVATFPKKKHRYDKAAILN